MLYTTYKKKIQRSSLSLWLSRPVWVLCGWKPQRKVPRFVAYYYYLHFGKVQGYFLRASHSTYRIRSNYRTVRLGFFSKLLGKIYGKICIYLLGIHFSKRSVNDFFNDFFAICFLIFFIKAYVVGTHLNCIDKWMQFKWVPTTYALIK